MKSRPFQFSLRSLILFTPVAAGMLALNMRAPWVPRSVWLEWDVVFFVSIFLAYKSTPEPLPRIVAFLCFLTLGAMLWLLLWIPFVARFF